MWVPLHHAFLYLSTCFLLTFQQIKALEDGRQQTGAGYGDDSGVEINNGSRKRFHYNKGVLVPVGSNSGFQPLTGREAQSVGISIYRPQQIGSSWNRPVIVGSSGSEDNISLQPIPTSIFDRLESNTQQPIYIFTRINPITGGIVSPNLIFRVNFAAGKPVKPYLLTYLMTGIAQPILKSLLNILNEHSNGPEEPTYLLSRVNETSGIPIPPFLIFNINRATEKSKAPYVLSRLDTQSRRPTQPEILQYLDRETGQFIVQEMLPLLNQYIAQGSKKK